MVIEEADFKMESDNRGRFDLFFRNNTNTNWKLYGYSMTLKNCIQAISHERLSQKLDVIEVTKNTCCLIYSKYFESDQNIKEDTY
jgi:hypothetical protein